MWLEVIWHRLQTKTSSYSRYYAQACNQWRGPSPRHSAWVTQLRKNVAVVASSWRHCVLFNQPGTRTQTSHILSDVFKHYTNRSVWQRLRLTNPAFALLSQDPFLQLPSLRSARLHLKQPSHFRILIHFNMVGLYHETITTWTDRVVVDVDIFNIFRFRFCFFLSFNYGSLPRIFNVVFLFTQFLG